MEKFNNSYNIAETTLIAQSIKLIKNLKQSAIEKNDNPTDRSIELTKSIVDTAVTEDSFIHFFDKLFKDVERDVELTPSFTDINLSLIKYQEKYKEYMDFYLFLTQVFNFDFDNFKEDLLNQKLITFFIKYMLLKRQFEFLLTLECYIVFNAPKDMIGKYINWEKFRDFIVPKLYKKEIINYKQYQDIKNNNYELKLVTSYIENMKENLGKINLEESGPVEPKKEKDTVEQVNLDIVEYIKNLQAEGKTVDKEIKNELLHSISSKKLWFNLSFSVQSLSGYYEPFKPLAQIETSFSEVINFNNDLKEKLKESIPEHNRNYDNLNTYIFTLSYVEPETDLNFPVTISDDMEYTKITINGATYTIYKNNNYNRFNLIDCLNTDIDSFVCSDCNYDEFPF